MMAQSQLTKESQNKYDKYKWAFIAILVAIGVVSNYYFAEQPLVIRFVVGLVLAAILVAIAVKTEKGKQAWTFLSDARAELRKVVWPTRQETVQTTLVLIAVIILMSLILWGVDTFLLWVVSSFTG